MLDMVPKVIRAKLNNPDAVIVRSPCGALIVVADLRVDDDFVAKCVREARHVRDGRPFGPAQPQAGVA